jgi:two-component system NtrC family response regulator
MVGDSPAMLEVFNQIRRFATCDVPVLITGESGTGKDHSGRAA